MIMEVFGLWHGSIGLTGKITGNEIQIPVHHAFRFENEKIVDVYHFFDPTLLDAELAASQK